MLNSIAHPTASTFGRLVNRTLTVCVVDPQPAAYSDWLDAAHASGLRLQILASAEEALRYSRTAAVDLWMIHTELPGLSGFELCGMLKARAPATPVYLVADGYSPAAEQRAWQARATMFAVKPARPNWLEWWAEQQAVRPPTVRPAQRGA
jgi:DNA-binding response OmpR family regulator